MHPFFNLCTTISISTLRALFGYKAWANDELFLALTKISAELHPNALHSAMCTMNHVHVVDRIFRARSRTYAMPPLLLRRVMC